MTTPAPEAQVLRCPSTVHGKRPPVASVRITYLPGRRNEATVTLCAVCANDLVLAGLAEAGESFSEKL